jgi:hypothetical protein
MKPEDLRVEGEHHYERETRPMSSAEVSGCFVLLALGMVCFTVLAVVWVVWG